MSGARVNRDGIRSKAESKNNHPVQDNNNNNNKIPFDPLARSNVDKQHLLVLEGVIFNRTFVSIFSTSGKENFGEWLAGVVGL